MRLSVIIVTWNSENVIGECLNSLLQYTTPEDEIIVVDNASSDNTRMLVESMNNPLIRLITSDKNLGFGPANNIGLSEAQGNYIALINPDIVFTMDCFTPSIDYLASHQGVGIISPKLINKDGSFQSTSSFYPTPIKELINRVGISRLLPYSFKLKYFPNHIDTNSIFEPDWTYSAFQVLRTQDMRDIGGFSSDYFMYCEDMDLCKKMNIILHKSTIYYGSINAVHIGGYSEGVSGAPNKARYCILGINQFMNKYYSHSTRNTLRAIKASGYFRKFIFSILSKYNNSYTGKLINENMTIKTCKELLNKRNLSRYI